MMLNFIKRCTPFALILIICATIFHINLMNYPVINPDGELYLTTANIFLQQGIHAAMQSYSWPLYPILIAFLVKVFHLEFLQAAYVLSFVFFTAATYAMYVMSYQLTESKIAAWLGLLLFVFFKTYNIFLHQVVRDLGYWCFVLWSLVFFIKYLQGNKFQYALFWFLSILLATLFRIEGAIILLFIPFVTLLIKEECFSSRLEKFLILEGMTVILALVGIIYIILLLHGNYTSQRLGRVNELIHDFSSVITSYSQAFSSFSTRVEKYVLVQDFNQPFASIFLLGGILLSFIVMMLSTIGLFNFVAFCYFWCQKTIKVNPIAHIVLMGCVFINFFIVLGFVFQTLYFVGRYGILFCLLLIPYASASLVAMYTNWKQKEKKWQLRNLLFPIMCLLLLLSVVDTFYHFGTSKQYVKNAAIWLRANIPASTTIYTNDKVLGYLSQHEWVGGSCDNFSSPICYDKDKINTIPWKQQSVIVLNVNATPENITTFNKLTGLQPVIIFKSNKEKAVIIYKR